MPYVITLSLQQPHTLRPSPPLRVDEVAVKGEAEAVLLKPANLQETIAPVLSAQTLTQP